MFRSIASLGEVMKAVPQAGSSLVPIVNGEYPVSDAKVVPLKEGDQFVYAAKDVVQACREVTDRLGRHDQQMVLHCHEQRSVYCERPDNMELELHVYWDGDCIVTVNDPLPADYATMHIPALLPLDGYPSKPPPGLPVPRESPATPLLARFCALLPRWSSALLPSLWPRLPRLELALPEENDRRGGWLELG